MDAVAPIIYKLDQAGFPFYRMYKITWYRAKNVEVGQREFHRPGRRWYLVRLIGRLGA